MSKVNSNVHFIIEETFKDINLSLRQKRLEEHLLKIILEMETLEKEAETPKEASNG
jgi:hypothetical protein